MLRRVGVEPTGEAFNSIVMDEVNNRPFNPMVNAGAIATTSLIKGNGADVRFARILNMFERYAGRKLTVDDAGLPVRARHGAQQPRDRLPSAQFRNDR